MQFSRLPRFKRRPTIGPIILTARDRKIIQIIHLHRFVTSSQIIALVGGSGQQVLRRLQLLYHGGYLERPRCQIDYYHRGGSRPIVYGIGNKGGALLKRELGLALHASRWNEKNGSVNRIFLEHALLVSGVMVSLELACRSNGNIQLLHFDQVPFPDGARGSPACRWRVRLNHDCELGVIPDRLFALEYIDKNGKPDQAYFFLEADRGTMPVKRRNLIHTSFYRKLLAYEATWSQSIHRTHFGFHRFRVLTVTTSVKRLSALVEACSQLKTGHGLFLFIDSAALRRVDDMFSLVWHTGRQGERSTLLD